MTNVRARIETLIVRSTNIAPRVIQAVNTLQLEGLYAHQPVLLSHTLVVRGVAAAAAA